MARDSQKNVDASVSLRLSRGSDCADVVVLAGGVGLDESWTCGQSRSLLSLPGKTLLDDVLTKVSAAFDGTIAVCSNGHAETVGQHVVEMASTDANILVREDRLPRGSAGCIKACEPELQGETIFVVGASVWLEDDPQWMLEEHKRRGNVVTVFCIPNQVGTGSGSETRMRPAGIYCCEPEVLEHIQPTGFQDLKEQLIPTLLAQGFPVGVVALKGQTHQVLDWATYLHAITRSLSNEQFSEQGFEQLAPAIWCGQNVTIADDARVVGPALLGHGCNLESGSVIIGPAMLGDNCTVSSNSTLIRTVVPELTTLAESSSLIDQIVPTRWVDKSSDRLQSSARSTTQATGLTDTRRRVPIGESARAVGQKLSLGFGANTALFVWAFWSNFEGLWEVWQTDPNYGAGQLVPLAAAYMVATKRRALEGLSFQISYAGIAVFSVGMALNLFGYQYLYMSFSNLGMVICASGVVMTLTGWDGYKRIWYPLALLGLMTPLPARIHDAIMLPLQTFGARVSATILEIGGIPVERFGNLLEVAGQRIAVAEACNGLRMAIAFLIVTAVVAYIVERPTWQRVVILLSSIPIAMGCNVARIVGTAYLYSAGYDWLAQGVFHDGAGLLMMPLALILVLVELRLLSNLSVTLFDDQPSMETAEQVAATPVR